MCKHHGEASLNPWANIIENHQEETLAHWESHFTNTCIEELNSVFSATKRKARGHHTTKEANHHANTSPSVNSTSPPQCTTENVEEPFLIIQLSEYKYITEVRLTPMRSAGDILQYAG